jgi:uncharacterized membrane protein YjfL (UPF0719 family)
MDTILLPILGWILYLVIGILLFILNMMLFEYWTPFDVRHGIIRSQNKALGLIIRWQFIAQGVMISALIFFTGYTPDHAFLQMSVFLPSILMTLSFGLIGMIVLQWCLWIIMRLYQIEKEIIVDQNESLGMIIEAFLIATALLVSVAFYSY